MVFPMLQCLGDTDENNRWSEQTGRDFMKDMLLYMGLAGQ